MSWKVRVTNPTEDLRGVLKREHREWWAPEKFAAKAAAEYMAEQIKKRGECDEAVAIDMGLYVEAHS